MENDAFMQEIIDRHDSQEKTEKEYMTRDDIFKYFINPYCEKLENMDKRIEFLQSRFDRVLDLFEKLTEALRFEKG